MDILKKMTTELNEVVFYYLNINDNSYFLNDLVDSVITINRRGKVVCSCGKKMDRFYRSSFCYPCFWNSPLASQSIFRPELCTAHLNIEERDLSWEKEFQIAPHYVYLANSSGIKVGITRERKGIVRWMDQGASQAIIFAEVPNRRFSGDIEVALKAHVSDKTNWRKMLSANPEKVDLVAIKNNLIQYTPEVLKKYIVSDNTVTEIKYPVKEYPIKVKSLKLEKENKISGVLKGVKGQYLILDNNRVFNVRAHEGFLVDFSTEKIDKQIDLF